MAVPTLLCHLFLRQEQYNEDVDEVSMFVPKYVKRPSFQFLLQGVWDQQKMFVLSAKKPEKEQCTLLLDSIVLMH